MEKFREEFKVYNEKGERLYYIWICLDMEDIENLMTILEKLKDQGVQQIHFNVKGNIFNQIALVKVQKHTQTH